MSEPSAEDPLQDLAVEDLRLVVTPGGLRPAEKVLPVSSGEVVRVPRRRRVTVRPDKGVLLDGTLRANWIVAAYATGPIVQDFSCDIVVPAAPAVRAGQLVYVFAGLQDEPTTMIIQPVVQWGVPGEPAGWRLCSWLVDRQAGTARPTQSVAVTPGTTVRARVRMVSRAGNRFLYQCGFEGVPQTTLQASVPGMRTAVAVLEAYGMHGAPTYPPEPPIRFRQVSLAPQAAAGWAKQDLVIDCGQHAEIVQAHPPCVFELHCRP